MQADQRRYASDLVPEPIPTLLSILRNTLLSLTQDKEARALCERADVRQKTLARWGQPMWIRAVALFCEVDLSDYISEETLVELIGTRAARHVQRAYKTLSTRKACNGKSEEAAVETVLCREAEISSDKEGSQAYLVLSAGIIASLAVASSSPFVELAALSVMVCKISPAWPYRVELTSKLSCPFTFVEQERVTSLYQAALRDSKKEILTSTAMFSECSRICPWIFEPLVLRACSILIAGDEAAALYCLKEAKSLQSATGLVWDCSLSFEEWNWITETMSGDITRSKKLLRGRAEALSPLMLIQTFT